jgi:hypothetical protein
MHDQKSPLADSSQHHDQPDQLRRRVDQPHCRSWQVPMNKSELHPAVLPLLLVTYSWGNRSLTESMIRSLCPGAPQPTTPQGHAWGRKIALVHACRPHTITSQAPKALHVSVLPWDSPKPAKAAKGADGHVHLVPSGCIALCRRAWKTNWRRATRWDRVSTV